MAPLVIVPPDCATRAKAAFVQVWSPAGRKTRWIPLLKIPLTVIVVRERSMMLGVRITVGGAGGGEGLLLRKANGFKVGDHDVA